VTQPPEPEPPEPELHGVRALVTGGTSGLGFAMSQALAEAGARVALTGRTEAIMGPPVVWLASRASDGQTDQRIVAREFAANPPA